MSINNLLESSILSLKETNQRLKNVNKSVDVDEMNRRSKIMRVDKVFSLRRNEQVRTEIDAYAKSMKPKIESLLTSLESYNAQLQTKSNLLQRKIASQQIVSLGTRKANPEMMKRVWVLRQYKKELIAKLEACDPQTSLRL